MPFGFQMGTTVTGGGGVPAQLWDYYVYKDGSTYKFLQLSTGSIQYSGGTFNTLFDSVITAQAAGTRYKLAPGVFNISAEIHVSKGITIEGSGIDETIIRAVAGYAANNHLINAETAVASNKLYISNLTLDGDQGTGQTSNAQGLWWKGFSGRISYVKVMDAYATGINVMVDALAVDRVEIIECQAFNCGVPGAIGPGIKVDHSVGSTQFIDSVLVFGCKVDQGGEHGIKCYDSTVNRIQIIGNYVYHVDKAGIWCEGPGVVQGNEVQNAGGNGIVLDHYPIVCNGNRILDSGGVESAFRGGIYVNADASGSIISNNYIFNSTEHGIQLQAGLTDVTVSGNRIITAGGKGLYTQATYSQVTGNHFETTNGIFEGAGADYNKYAANKFNCTTAIEAIVGANNLGDDTWLGGTSSNLLNNATTEYFTPFGKSTKTATESGQIMLVGRPCTVIGMRVNLTAAPTGAGKSYTILIRKYGVGDTAITTTIADADTTGTFTGAVAIAAGDRLSVKSNGGANIPTASMANTALQVIYH